MDNAHFDQYISLYIKTGKEYINTMQNAINILMKNPTDKNQMEQLYIGAHNIKSQSLVMGFESLGNLMHEMEKLVKSHIEKNIPFSQDQLTVLKRIIDPVESIVVNASSDTKSLALNRELDTINSIKN